MVQVQRKSSVVSRALRRSNRRRCRRKYWVHAGVNRRRLWITINSSCLYYVSWRLSFLGVWFSSFGVSQSHPPIFYHGGSCNMQQIYRPLTSSEKNEKRRQWSLPVLHPTVFSLAAWIDRKTPDKALCAIISGEGHNLSMRIILW